LVCRFSAKPFPLRVLLPLLSKGGIINLIAKSLIFRGFIKGLLFLFFCVLVSMLVTQQIKVVPGCVLTFKT
jgi:hypothetical protein